MPEFKIGEVKEKKISFKEGIIFTKIARKVKIRQYKKEITQIFNQVRANKDNMSTEQLKELAQINKIKNPAEKQKAKQAFDTGIIEKAGLEIGIDMGLYLIEMIGEAENEVIELISAYTKQAENLIQEADLEDIIKVLKIMWESGLYKVFYTFLNKESDKEDPLKKK